VALVRRGGSILLDFPVGNRLLLPGYEMAAS
jgi:hypothetical protein